MSEGQRYRIRELMNVNSSQRTEITRLGAALLTCSTLARGEKHADPWDRCEAICLYVQVVLENAGGDSRDGNTPSGDSEVQCDDAPQSGNGCGMRPRYPSGFVCTAAGHGGPAGLRAQ